MSRRLESILQCKLNDSCLRCRAHDLAETGSKVDSRHRKIRTVERIEEFGPKLQRLPLSDDERLVQVEVQVNQVRATKDANARISERLIGDESSTSRIVVQQLKGCHIQIHVHRSLAFG